MSTFFQTEDSEYFFVKRLLSLFFIFVFLIWFLLTKNIKPDLTITPVPPGAHLLKALSMGDDNLVYRHYGYQVQIAGDDYGTTTPLKNYNYAKLQKWFYLLDEFDPKSEYVPSIAGFYYSNSQNKLDNVYIVDYLVKFGDRNPTKNWRWYTTAVYLASVMLHDHERVKEIAGKLVTLDSSVPLWARTIGIFIASKKDICASVDLIASLDEKELESIVTDKAFSAQGDEGNVFLHLIVQRIEEIKKNPEAVAKCVKERKKLKK